MKKLFTLLLMITMAFAPIAYADNTANIKIKIAGAVQGNNYFLCMPDMGCLSILAAQEGKVYPIMREVDMNTLFITDTRTMRVYNQGLPHSCDVTVKPNQTITISGNLVKHADTVTVSGLRCSVS